ncbi:methyl-accepting chemotaxis protein [Reinekea marinisedimentorum]|uniref:Methyl-accepting chemotaxis protein n=1 Tax=Reinekea marinisedimentorum TaxID=230495 RepID=A0A4R3I7G5_9GAMM|nr:methyl-accepting chemotaxis protein [Reinekea marinisedimentorum]TCS40814.1 methyl-accepting chemotaxis protein [Reinekea marinisedimentorum]
MTYAFRNRAFQISFLVNLGLMIYALALASWYGTWLQALIIGLPSLLVPYGLYRLLGDHTLSRIAYGFSYMIFSALHIHQGAGMIELHFGIFVLLALLIVFRDWLVIVAAAALIAVHHLSFMYMQAAGAPVFVFPAASLSFGIVMLHAAYVVVEALVLVAIAVFSLSEARQAEYFLRATDQMVDADGKIWLGELPIDKHTELTRKFAGVIAKLRSTIAMIDQSSGALKSETEQLVDQGNSMAQDMSDEAAQVDTIASATEQMSATIRDLVALSEQVLAMAGEQQQASQSGQASVGTMKETILELSQTLETTKSKVNGLAESTSDIRGVLEVIQSIAEQTNLLALNAAIEAARAGEHGRGFAVVADEVRSLASRTHQSTGEIQSMIERLVQSGDESVESVGASIARLQSTIEVANESHAWLDKISEHASSVLESAGTMSSTLAQQGAASEEIAHSANRLNLLSSALNQKGIRVVEIAQDTEEVSSRLKKEADQFRYQGDV